LVQQNASDDLPPVVDDQRGPGRKKVYLRGKVVYGNNGEFSLECLIHDLSTTGARIGLKKNEFIPKHFHLIDLQSSVIYEATVMWIKVRQTIPQFGVKLTNAQRLDHISDPKLQFLKPSARRERRAVSRRNLSS